VSDEEWALVAPYLTLLPEQAGQREHSLHEVFNGLRYAVKTGAPWRWIPNDLPPWAAVYQLSMLPAASPKRLDENSPEWLVL
jgi:transposase